MKKGARRRTSFGAQIKRNHSEVFLGKGVLKICSKFTREHPCQSAHFGMGVIL